MIKHATSSVYVFDRHDGEWLLGLVEHPRFRRWMVPGGHVEANENTAEAAHREVAEEIGRAIRLVPAVAQSALSIDGADNSVPLPFLIVEQVVPADRIPDTHVHVDHLYLALAGERIGAAELPVRWCRVAELDELDMFDDTRTTARQLFLCVDRLAEALDPPVASGDG